MSYGADWICECGWANLDVRNKCRHCGQVAPSVDCAKATEQALADYQARVIPAETQVVQLEHDLLSEREAREKAERERDELDFLLNEGGSWKKQLQSPKPIPDEPECQYCGATDGIRVECDGGGYIAPEYTCERCFTPTDTGPCFDDLKPTTVIRAFVNEHAREVKITIEGPSSISENTLTEMEARHMRDALSDAIPLTPAERQSGLTRVQWAENLIRQLPEDHNGRNSWLLNYGGSRP